MALLDLILGRRSIENPKTPLSNPDAWLLDSLGSWPTAAGVRVNRETALTYNPVWRAVNLVARDVAKLPIYTYRRLGQRGEGKQLADRHQLYDLLRWKPNREMTAFQFKQVMMVHALLGRGGFAYIFRRGDGSPEELIPLDSEATYAERSGGRLYYVTTVRRPLDQETWEQRRLLPENVLHIRGMGFNGLEAISLVAKARESFGLGMAAERYGSAFFGNNATPNIAIEFPGKMKPEAAMKFLEKFNAKHQGLDNAHRAALLQEGMKIVQYSIHARNAQLEETRLHEILSVANWFNVPPHKLGHTSRTSYASLEQENQSYLDEALDPWLVNWEEELRDKLLTEKEKSLDSHTIEFLRQALVRADMAQRYQAYSIGLNNRILNPNEVRAMENLNPYEGGEKFAVPLNIQLLTPGQDIEPPEPPSPPAPEPAPPQLPAPAEQQPPETNSAPAPIPPALLEPHRELLREAARRMVKRIGLHAERAAKTPATFLTWIDSFADAHRSVFQEALGPVERACAAVLGQAPSRNLADWLLVKLRDDFLDLSGRCHAGNLARAVTQRIEVQQTEMSRQAVDVFLRDFCPTGQGGGVDPGCGAGEGGGAAPAMAASSSMPATRAALDEAASAQAGSWMQTAKDVPGKIMDKAREKIGSYYTKLEGRYGGVFAKGIIAAGIVGIPIPAPGASLLTAAPVIAAAELWRAFGKRNQEEDDLAKIYEAAKVEWDALFAEWISENPKE